jgi:hypothetical protein
MRRSGVGSATTTASRADYLVCPGCGCSQLQPTGGFLSRLVGCDFCKRAFDNTIVGTLIQTAGGASRRRAQGGIQ